MNRSNPRALAFGAIALVLGLASWLWLWDSSAAPNLDPAFEQIGARSEEAGTQVAQAPRPADFNSSSFEGLRQPIGAVSPLESVAPSPRDLVVQVLDEQGKAVANVPVDILLRYEMGKSGHQVHGQAVSDAEGLARFSGSAAQLDVVFPVEPEEQQEPRDRWDAIGIGVVCALPLGGGESGMDPLPIVWLAEPPPTGDPVIIKLPAVGWIEVVLDPQNNALSQPGLLTRVAWRRAEAEHIAGFRGALDFPVGETGTLIGPLGLGWKVQLTLTKVGRCGDLAQVVLDGPDSSSRVVTAKISASAVVPLAGTAVYPSGEAVANKKLRFYVGELDSPIVPRTSVHTNDAGHWSIDVPLDSGGKDLFVKIKGMPPTPYGVTSIRGELVAGELIEIGQIVIHPQEGADQLMVSGTVRDQDGKPLPGAWALVHALDKGVLGSEPVAKTLTDKDGKYSITMFGQGPLANFKVFAAHQDYLRTKGRLAVVGSAGIDLELALGGSISADVMVEDWIHLEDILLRVETDGLDRILSLMEFGFAYGSSLGGLSTGPHTLKFEIRSADWVIHTVDVESTVGEDFRLGNIDLRGLVRKVELHLTNAEGDLGDFGSVRLVDAAGVGFERLSTNEAGLLELLVPAQVEELFLFGPGVSALPVSLGPNIDGEVTQREVTWKQ